MASSIAEKEERRTKKIPKNAKLGSFTFDGRDYEFVRQSGRYLLRTEENESTGIKIYLARNENTHENHWTPTEMYHYRTSGRHNMGNLGPFHRGLIVNSVVGNQLSKALQRYLEKF
jgi:hypothetical protein